MIALLLATILSAGTVKVPPKCIIPRDHHGKIARSGSAVRDFKRHNTCPSTGFKSTSSCPGYMVDHICPLACGGYDKPSNMQWLTNKDNLKKGADCSDCRPVNQRPECRHP